MIEAKLIILRGELTDYHKGSSSAVILYSDSGNNKEK